MLWLFMPNTSWVVCQNVPTQDWVTVDKRRVLVRSIRKGELSRGVPCTVWHQPCVTTLKVQRDTPIGFALMADGSVLTRHRADSGTPPGTVMYKVNLIRDRPLLRNFRDVSVIGHGVFFHPDIDMPEEFAGLGISGPPAVSICRRSGFCPTGNLLLLSTIQGSG